VPWISLEASLAKLEAGAPASSLSRTLSAIQARRLFVLGLLDITFLMSSSLVATAAAAATGSPPSPLSTASSEESSSSRAL